MTGRQVGWVVVGLLVLYVLLGVLGAVVKGLFWLLVIAAALFVVTAWFGGRRTRR